MWSLFIASVLNAQRYGLELWSLFIASVAIVKQNQSCWSLFIASVVKHGYVGHVKPVSPRVDVKLKPITQCRDWWSM